MKKFAILLTALMMAAPLFAQEEDAEKQRVLIEPQMEINVGYGTGGSGTILGSGISADTYYQRVFWEFVPSVRITPYAAVGLGIGVQHAWDADAMMMPVFGELKGYCPIGKAAPYVAVDLGYGVGLDQFEGGFYGSFGAGVNYGHLNIGFGYQMQYLYEPDTNSELGLRVGSFFVKVGVKF